MLLGKLDATLLGNMSVGKRVIQASKEQGKIRTDIGPISPGGDF